MPDKISLSDEHRKLLLNIAAVLNLPDDELMSDKYEVRDPAYVQEYLEGFIASASDEKLLLAYLLLTMLTAKMK